MRNPYLLGAIRERPAAQRLDRVEQKVTAIEQRDREQVQQPDRDRQHRRQVNQRDEAGGRHLPDTCAMRIGPPSWSANSRPTTTPPI